MLYKTGDRVVLIRDQSINNNGGPHPRVWAEGCPIHAGTIDIIVERHCGVKWDSCLGMSSWHNGGYLLGVDVEILESMISENNCIDERIFIITERTISRKPCLK